MSHDARPVLKSYQPVHVTTRMCERVCHLRTAQCLKVLRQAFVEANDRCGFKLVHYSIQGNHLHLIVEADSARELTRGMQGLSIRIARALNRLMRRKGKVFADRYHSVVLQTPTQAAHALHYVLHNRQHHAPGRYAPSWRDPFASSAAPLVEPRTWLLDRGPLRAKRMKTTSASRPAHDSAAGSAS